MADLLTVEVLEDPSLPTPLIDQWARLATDSGRPLASPHWLIPLWRHTKENGERLRIFTVTDESGILLGVMPLVNVPTRFGHHHRFLGAGFATECDVLLRASKEDAVIAALGSKLLSVAQTPTAILFQETPSSSSAPTELAATLEESARARLFEDMRQPVPALVLEDHTFDEWFAGRSRNFRSNMRRYTRKLEAAGARFEVVDSSQDWKAEIDRFASLHHSNWETRGGSGVLAPGSPRALAESAELMAKAGQIRLHKIVIDDHTIATALFFSGGGTHLYWLGGYDQDYSELRPGFMVVFDGIRSAIDSGARVINLGVGDQEYKHRFANRTLYVNWYTLAVGARLPQLQRFTHARPAIRAKLIAALPDHVHRKIRSVVRRLRSIR